MALEKSFQWWEVIIYMDFKSHRWGKTIWLEMISWSVETSLIFIFLNRDSFRGRILGSVWESMVKPREEVKSQRRNSRKSSRNKGQNSQIYLPESGLIPSHVTGVFEPSSIMEPREVRWSRWHPAWRYLSLAKRCSTLWSEPGPWLSADNSEIRHNPYPDCGDALQTDRADGVIGQRDLRPSVRMWNKHLHL